MKHGARKTITPKLRSVKKGDVLSLIKSDVVSAVEMSSVLTSEAVEDMKLNVGG